jgi:hypothetical protein
MEERVVANRIKKINDELQEALGFASQIIFDESKSDIISKEDIKYLYMKIDSCATRAQKLHLGLYLHDDANKEAAVIYPYILNC